jgi:hypothetical protein
VKALSGATGAARAPTASAADIFTSIFIASSLGGYAHAPALHDLLAVLQSMQQAL